MPHYVVKINIQTFHSFTHIQIYFLIMKKML